MGFNPSFGGLFAFFVGAAGIVLLGVGRTMGWRKPARWLVPALLLLYSGMVVGTIRYVVEVSRQTALLLSVVSILLSISALGALVAALAAWKRTR